MAAQTLFYVEDVCKPSKELNDGVKRAAFGLVLATHTDVDSHNPALGSHNSQRHQWDIPHAEYKKYRKTGVPPKDTVLVEWGSIDKGTGFSELIHTKYLELVDRALIVGDFVKRSTNDSMIGTVIGASVKCSLMPVLYRPNYDNPYGCQQLQELSSKLGYSSLVLEAFLGPDFLVHGNAAPPHAMLSDIPATELKTPEKYQTQDLVVYQDWIGIIDEMSDVVKVMLPNNKIVALRDEDELPFGLKSRMWETAEVPELIDFKGAKITKPDSYTPETLTGVPPIGFLVERTPDWIHVRWLIKRWPAPDKPDKGPLRDREPPSTIHADELERGAVHVYHHSGFPPNPDALQPIPFDLLPNERVRFKDLSGAAMKYDGRHSSNHLRRIDSSYTAGYDLNVFEVRGTETIVKVQWQDQSITECPSFHLIPDVNQEDESSFQPGEIVNTHDKKENEQEPYIFEPKKVGVVQSVNAADRIARVRWFKDASVKYPILPGIDELAFLLPESTTGLRTDEDEYEDLSVYDIEHAALLNKRRGDMVILHPPSSTPDINKGDGIDWFGEVIDLGLDGLLTVRLGALDEVRDVLIAPEYTTIAYSDDMRPFEDDDDDEDEEDDDGTWEDDGDSWEDDSHSFYPGISNLLVSELREIFYNDADGNQVRVEDKTGELEFDEDWSTEDEDGSTDEDLPDLIPLDDGVALTGQEAEEASHQEMEINGIKTPLDSTTQSSPQISAHQTTEPENEPATSNTTAENEPPHFLVLDSAVPIDHGYIAVTPTNSPSLLKRIHKEHKILLSSLPSGIYVRTWDTRLDLFRVLIVGPTDTPYEYAPFIVDLRLPSDYPFSPPDAYFHSWTSRGYGPVNPNLYENGKICLSLLGTWDGEEKMENWVPSRSNLLQVLISIQGLVLVKEPYFNEAGYEVRAGSEESKVPSRIYSEKIYFVARGFIVHALKKGVPGFADVLKWLYCSEGDGGPRLLDKAIDAAEGLVGSGEVGKETGGLSGISKGAIVMLERRLKEMELLREATARHEDLR